MGIDIARGYIVPAERFQKPRGRLRAMADPTKPPLGEGVPQIQIDIDEVTAQGAYANLVLLNHNDNEFVFDFAYVQAAAPRARVRARIISSPRHAKRFLRALEANIHRYEERFGKIHDPETPPTLTSPNTALA